MPSVAVLDDYQDVALKVVDWSPVAKKADIVQFKAPFKSVEDAVKQLKNFDVVCLMRERTAFPRDLIEKLTRLRLIALTGLRSRTLDVAAATEHGIVVSNSGFEPAPHSTPELTWALILSAARRIPACDRAMRSGGWLDGVELGTVLHSKTLGVIGLGHVGVPVARIGKAFGMKVVAWSPNLSAHRAAEIGAHYVAKDELLSSADVVSLHLVLSERTRGVIGRREFALMKRSAIFVNCARGPLVDEAALEAALSERRIAIAALDVYDIEPLPDDHPFRRLDNVVLTPHLGYVTEDHYRAYYSGAMQAIAAYLAGSPIHVVNPEVMKSLPLG